MPIQINDGFKLNAPRAADMRYGKLVAGKTVPYGSKAEVFALIPEPYRHVGLSVNINGEEWWWKNGISDEGLVLKTAATGGTVVVFVVKEEDVGAVDKIIPELAGKNFLIERDIAPLVLDNDYTIYSGGGFAMVNPRDAFVLGQTFKITVVENLLII